MSAERSNEADGPRVIPKGWFIYRGTGVPRDERKDVPLRKALPPPPPWRDFTGGPVLSPPAEDLAELDRRLGPVDFLPPRRADPKEVAAVNAALCLRRPLLVTGNPGVGKSTLAYQISRELHLGPVLRWPVNSRTTLRSGLYEYDAIGRVQDARTRAGNEEPEQGTDIGEYLRLGPLGTALLPYRLPRVLLIDEFDKSDADLANDLLDVLEEGSYQVPELFRIRSRTPEVAVHISDPEQSAVITKGAVCCRAFPFIVITSNGEREFPPAFLRRCVQLHMVEPGQERLAELVTARFSSAAEPYKDRLIQEFLAYRRRHPVAADQLLNALYLAIHGQGGQDPMDDQTWKQVLDVVLQRLDAAGAG
ncbi:AAA family ATPase [Planomonospora venezuelensis]|uniref:MoxR-like ATPase n=1 Tax=Planomonospora venezuelensis TaxID=1999 RepID=A0A841D0R1_PLAVE|nr:MoxR family ATPase [Planomonospora venezuelensis]MBB5961978.1 MoxR-like ATPase [Planomonospora venezuelensis]GIN00078.1 ATPase AAA [Planomonospora venezuelensis]